MVKFGTEAQCEAALEVGQVAGFFYALIVNMIPVHVSQEAVQNVSATSASIKPPLSPTPFFNGTKLPLTKWFLGMHLMTQSKSRTSL